VHALAAVTEGCLASQRPNFHLLLGLSFTVVSSLHEVEKGLRPHGCYARIRLLRLQSYHRTHVATRDVAGRPSCCFMHSLFHIMCYHSLAIPSRDPEPIQIQRLQA
jgi:hypothetical protein